MTKTTKKRRRDPVLAGLADAAKGLAGVAKAASGEPISEGDSEGDSEELEGADLLEEEEIERAVADIPTRAEANVERRNREGRWVHLDTITPDQVTTTQFAEMYGGGVYRVKFRGPGKGKEKGKLVYRPGYKLVEVDSAIPSKAPPKYRPDASSAPAAAVASPGLDVATEMAKLSLTVLQAVGALMTRASQPDPMQTEILRALLNKKEPDSFDRALEMAKVMGGGGGGGLKARLEELELIESIAERRGGGGRAEKGATGWDIASKAIDGLAELLAGGGRPRVPQLGPGPRAPGAPAPAPGSGPAPGPQPSTPPAAAGPADPANPNPPTEAQQVDLVAQALGNYLPQLAQKAAEDKDPDLWAGLMLEELPRGFYPRVLEFLERPGLLEELGKAYPAVVQYREWFGEFIDAARERLEELTGREPPGSDGQADG